MKVYSIVAYDSANDEPPRVSVFSSEDAAVQSVVDEVAEFSSLHEAGGDFSLAETGTGLKLCADCDSYRNQKGTVT